MTITLENYKTVIPTIREENLPLSNFNITFSVRGEEFEYHFRDTYLSNKISNEIIFNALNIEDKESFCSNSYGYQCSGGCFPECRKQNRLDSLLNVTWDLFVECERLTKPLKKLVLSEISLSMLSTRKRVKKQLTKPVLNSLIVDDDMIF